MGNDSSTRLGWAEIGAGLLAIAIATVAAPSPAASSDGTVGPMPARVSDGEQSPPLLPDLAHVDASSTDDLATSIAVESVPLRFAPPVDGQQGIRPNIVIRNDRWNLLTLGDVARVSAFSRGTLMAEDADLARGPSSLPRQAGTGFGMVTSTPLYVGAALRTDRAIYDFDMSRFRGARWTTSLFVGADTALGPLYLGTNREPGGARATYLYLGRWF